MERFKGTPGPWTMRMTGKLNKHNAYMIAIDCLSDGSGVEQMATIWAWGEKDKTAIANAKLIATAPELLEALQKLVAQFRRVDPIYSSDKLLIEYAERVITKSLKL